MHHYLPISAVLLTQLVACREAPKPTVAPRAEQAATEVRDRWKTLRKPIEIELVGTSASEIAGLREIGVYVPRTAEMTAEEQERLSGVPFLLQEGRYRTARPYVLLSDSLAPVYLCYPCVPLDEGTERQHLRAPFGEHLYGIEHERRTTDTLRIRAELRSSMALIRLCLESEHLHDRLDALTLAGDPLCTEADLRPYQGQWENRQGLGGTLSATDADCLLNNGREHDIYVVPTDTAATLTIRARVNGRDLEMRTAVPPLLAGSLTRLGIKLTHGQLQAGSSWVETRRKLTLRTPVSVDSVRVGDFLQDDGTLSHTPDEHSLALVLQTDGKHGRAVALTDCDGEQSFGGAHVTSGRTFATIDGRRTEGIINPGRDHAVPDSAHIVYKPDIPYPATCALGYTDGAALTQRMLQRTTDDALAPVTTHAGSYLPSLGELAQLYFLMQPYSHTSLPDCFALPQGNYLSCSEKPNNSVYTLDFATGAVTACSKAYGKAHLRLYYLF
jgi:hypothetical protein